MSKVEDVVAALQTYTRLTGNVTDQQIKNLNAYPIVFLDGTLRHELQIDLENQTVTYDLRFPRGKTDSNRENYEKLEIAIQTLMGPNWLVRCVMKKKTIFEGTRKKAVYTIDGAVIVDAFKDKTP